VKCTYTAAIFASLLFCPVCPITERELPLFIQNKLQLFQNSETKTRRFENSKKFKNKSFFFITTVAICFKNNDFWAQKETSVIVNTNFMA